MLTLGMEMGNLKKIGIFPHKYESFPQPSDTCLLNTLAQLGNSSYPNKQAGGRQQPQPPGTPMYWGPGLKLRGWGRARAVPLAPPPPFSRSKTQRCVSVRWGWSQRSGSTGMLSVPRSPCTQKPWTHRACCAVGPAEVRGKAAPTHNYF